MNKFQSFIFLALAGTASRTVWAIFIQSGGLDTINSAISKGEYPEDAQGTTVFTNIKFIDNTLVSMIAFNLPLFRHSYPIGRLFMTTFLPNVLVLTLILRVESLRFSNKRNSGRFALAWGFLSQIATSAITLPIYCIFNTIRAVSTSDSKATSPFIPGIHSIALLPSIALGFAIPAIMSFDPLQQGAMIQTKWILAFALFPLGIYVSEKLIILILLAVGPRQSLYLSSNFDYKMCQIAYLVCGIAATASHIYAFASIFKLPITTISEVLLVQDLPSLGLDVKCLRFLGFDYVVTFATLMTWGYMDLVSLSFRNFASMIVLLAAGTIFIGPGGTAAVTWAVREQALRVEKMKVR
ncbi:hypothetical protein DL95DRAFT_527079 [Leptodontidium sp. 2 PMI_412]|nr:hypothetical protein DL95DRAFT_527079 [Leptodontidium sp. 2 PMI_412]